MAKPYMYPTEKSISMNLFKIQSIVTWAQLFLTFEVMQAVRSQKYDSKRTLWHLTQHLVHPTAPYLQF